MPLTADALGVALSIAADTVEVLGGAMNKLILIFSAAVVVNAFGFDGITTFDCNKGKDIIQIRLFDNTSNGAPVVKETFAIVSKKVFGTVSSWDSYVVPGGKFTYSVNAVRKAAFEDHVNQLQFFCQEVGFEPALKAKW